MNKPTLFLLSFFVALFSFASFSFAAAPSTPTTGPAASMRAACAEAKWCVQNRGLCDAPTNPAHSGLWEHHRAHITSDKVKAVGGSPTYVLECLALGGENICTSGNSQIDVQLFGVDNLNKLIARDGYQFQGFFDANNNPISNPVQSDALGNFGPVEWMSITKTNSTHKFMILNYFYSEAPDAPQVGGQQQATLDFTVLSEDCVTYTWDPYGRVFDADTLEPLKGMSVELQTKAADGALARYRSQLGTVINPQTTKTIGMFSFVVEDGSYNLKVTDPSGAYTFPVDQISALNAGYASIYKDIYPAQTGLDIVQAGKILHRDIPLKLTAGRTPQVNPVEFSSLQTSVRKGTGTYVAEGIVSHPFSVVNVWTQKSAAGTAPATRYRMVGTTKADREGNFKVSVNQDLFEAGEDVFEVEAVKASVAGMPATQGASIWQKIVSIFVKSVEAQTQTGATTSTMKVEPIPNYLQGYAYNSAGVVIPNATVGVYLSFSNKPAHTVKADANGLFKISSEYLPSMEYSLRYTSPTGAVTNATTSTFVKQNAAYLAKEGVSITEYKDSKGNPAPQPTSAVAPTDQQAVDQQAAAQNKGNNNLIVAIVLLVLMVIVSIILGMYLLKKSKAPDMTI